SSPVRFVMGMLWSEPLFIPLVLGWLLFWSRYLTWLQNRDLRVACVFAGACLLTRHAAMPVIGTMLFTLTPLVVRRSWRDCVKPLIGLGLCAVPYLLWLYRTWLLSGAIAGARTPQPQPWWMIFEGFSATLSHWLLPGWYWDGTTAL